jgi:hypothetical protein
MRRTSLLASAAVLLTVACDPTGNVGPSAPATRFRFMNAVVDATALAVREDGVVLASGVSFGNVSGAQSITADSSILQVSRSSDNFLLGLDTLVAVSGRMYTMYGVGTVGNFKSLIVVDDTTFADSGFFKVRFVHGVEDESGFGLDLYVTAPSTDITGITPQIASLSYGAVSSYFANDTAARRLRVTRAGQTTVILDTTFIGAFPDSQVVTVVASEKAGGGPPFRFTAVVDRAP